MEKRLLYILVYIYRYNICQLLRVSRNRRQKYVQEKNMSLCEPRARYLNTCGYGHVSWNAAQLQHAPPEPHDGRSQIVRFNPSYPYEALRIHCVIVRPKAQSVIFPPASQSRSPFSLFCTSSHLSFQLISL